MRKLRDAASRRVGLAIPVLDEPAGPRERPPGVELHCTRRNAGEGWHSPQNTK